jgi:hypothetical protein
LRPVVEYIYQIHCTCPVTSARRLRGTIECNENTIHYVALSNQTLSGMNQCIKVNWLSIDYIIVLHRNQTYYSKRQKNSSN